MSSKRVDIRNLPIRPFNGETVLMLPSGRRQSFFWLTGAWAEISRERTAVGLTEEEDEELTLTYFLKDGAGAGASLDYVRQLGMDDRTFLLDMASREPGPDISIQLDCPACKQEIVGSFNWDNLFPWAAFGLDGWAEVSVAMSKSPVMAS